MKRKITLVGGGASGLLLAYAFIKQGWTVEIHEKSNRWGGLLSSTITTWGLVESAANGFIATHEVRDLAQDLGLELLPTQKKYPARFIFRREKARRFPVLISELPAVIKFLFKVILFKDRLLPKEFETLEEWGHRSLGPSLTEGLLAPAMYGVYNLMPQDLSARLVLNSLFHRKGSKKPPSQRIKGTVAPPGGMEEFVQKMVQFLAGQGVKLHLTSELKSLPEGDYVLCTAPEVAGHYLRSQFPEAARRLDSLKRLGIVSVTQFFSPHGSDLHGFGVLFKRGEGQARGRLFNTDIFFEREEKYRSETSIFSEEALKLSDQELLQACQADRKRLGMKSEPIHSVIYRWPKALPAYDLQLEEFLENQPVEIRGLIFGNYLGGLGLSKILSAAHAFVHAKNQALYSSGEA